jgi:hypothetical protein
MDFISEVYVSQQDERQFTAPSGTMYQIHGVAITNFSSAGAQFLITDRYVEEDLASINRAGDVFFAFDLAIDGNNMVLMLPEPIKTKHFSMGPDVEAPVAVVVIVYYTLIKATTEELVWEFIRRGKNP